MMINIIEYLQVLDYFSVKIWHLFNVDILSQFIQVINNYV